ncbi:DUF6414 family protein [Peribacillus frigoritolerans]|uniref:DUF6414 family protein n=1 Tax=Peribacillus frigoritolerans TaxID=450367 RepID=UPI003D2DA5A3
MRKIIYFDEGSATDILLIEHGGQISSIDEKKGTVSLKGEAGGEVSAGASTGFLTIVKAAFNTKVSANVSHSRDTLATKTVTNTIFTDFVALKEKLVEKKTIEILEGYKVTALKDSFAFMKMYAPYMKIFREGSEAIEALRDLDLQNVDEILTAAKGYYEMVAYNNEKEIVLRFNINAFKNAYMLTDLSKMNLTFIAIEVGDCNKEELIMQNELSGDSPSIESLDINAIMGNNPSTQSGTNTKLKLYDVILAGIGEIQNEN